MINENELEPGDMIISDRHTVFSIHDLALKLISENFFQGEMELIDPHELMAAYVAFDGIFHKHLCDCMLAEFSHSNMDEGTKMGAAIGSVNFSMQKAKSDLSTVIDAWCARQDAKAPKVQ